MVLPDGVPPAAISILRSCCSCLRIFNIITVIFGSRSRFQNLLSAVTAMLFVKICKPVTVLLLSFKRIQWLSRFQAEKSTSYGVPSTPGPVHIPETLQGPFHAAIWLQCKNGRVSAKKQNLSLCYIVFFRIKYETWKIHGKRLA